MLVLTAVSAFASDDPLQTFACGGSVAFATLLLWRLYEPPILLLPATIQLAQVITPRFYANALGVPIENISLHIGDLTAATWLALAAVTSLVVGLWIGQLGRTGPAPLRQEACAWSPHAAFVFCLATLALAAIFEGIGGIAEGVRQPALAAAGVQWVGVFVLTCVCAAQRRGIGYLLIIAAVEVGKGFTGYFGDFRSVFFVLLVALFSARSRIRPGTVFSAAIVCVVLLVMGAWWSVIKKEYRTYLNQGTRQQVIMVPIEDRIAFLVKKLEVADEKVIADGMELLLQRIGYVDYLSAVMRHIPARMPYQDGAQLSGTIMHVLQPRFLFPDKAPIPTDSEVLEKYTGFRWGASSGPDTSVSLGYITELYVDFGPYGCVLATFIIGLLVGRTYRFVVSSSSIPGLISYGLGLMLAMTIIQFEQALIKTVGSFVMAFLVILVLKGSLLPRLLPIFGRRTVPRVAVHAK